MYELLKQLNIETDYEIKILLEVSVNPPSFLLSTVGVVKRELCLY